MANSKDVFIKGKCKWARLDKLNKYGKWSIVVYPISEDIEKLRELQAEGVKNVMKKDDDGYYMTFTRPPNITVRGIVKGMTPPQVMEADGKTPLRNLIGNGSDVTVKLQAYKHNVPTAAPGTKATAIRLEAVRVDNLVPFEMNRDFQEDEQEQVSGVKDQPAPLF